MAGVKGEFVREFSVEEPVELVVTAGSGDVGVRRGPRGKVVVQGTYYVRAVPRSRAERLAGLIERHPPVELRGREIRVGELVRYTAEVGPSFLGEVFEGIEIDYEIEVPERTEARVEIGSGDVEVWGIAGPVRISAGSGDVELRDIAAEVEAKTGSGDVEAEDVDGDLVVGTGSGNLEARRVGGDLEARTGSGDIEIADLSGDLDVTTGSGDIRLEGVKGDIEARAGSGDIEIRSGLESGRVWRLRSGSGDIKVLLPSGTEARLELESRFGEVRSDLKGSPDAPAAIEAKTESGDIRVKVEGGEGK